MRIVVTGANGYLGTGVVKQLCDDGNEVIAVCHHDSKEIDEHTQIIKCNIFSVDDHFNEFEKPDVLLHMAWRNRFVHNDDSHVVDLPKHYSFLNKMAIRGVKNVVIGSMHEVGFFEGSIKEETPTHPESLYGISKDALRNMTKLICKNNNIIFQWLRGYYIVGNTERCRQNLV